MTNDRICQAVPVFLLFFFPEVIDTRGVFHPYSCLKEGYFFVKFRHDTVNYGKPLRDAPVNVAVIFQQQAEMSYGRQKHNTDNGQTSLSSDFSTARRLAGYPQE